MLMARTLAWDSLDLGSIPTSATTLLDDVGQITSPLFASHMQSCIMGMTVAASLRSTDEKYSKYYYEGNFSRTAMSSMASGLYLSYQ